MTKNRFEAFTDAVVAIVLTVLVLELDLPESGSFQALYAVRHEFLIYLVSFFSLAIYWNNHHQLLHGVKKIGGWTLWANNLLILALSLFPFATSWVSDFPSALGAQAFYGGVILLADFTYFLLCQALIAVNDQEVKKHIHAFMRKTRVTVVINCLALICGWLIRPELVIVIDGLSLLLWVVPYKSVALKKV